MPTAWLVRRPRERACSAGPRPGLGESADPTLSTLGNDGELTGLKGCCGRTQSSLIH